MAKTERMTEEQWMEQVAYERFSGADSACAMRQLSDKLVAKVKELCQTLALQDAEIEELQKANNALVKRLPILVPGASAPSPT